MIKPDFAKVYSAANEILVSTSVINTFPFDAKALIREQTDIRCRTYKKASEYGVDISEFGSESAVVIKFNGKTIIFYDSEKPETHNKFSLIHEAGHIINNHDFDYKSKEEYGIYEVEANYFTAQLLMPEQLIRYVQGKGVSVTNIFLQKHFGVSRLAAVKRLETLSKTNMEWYSRSEKEYDDIILSRFMPFLKKISPSFTDYYDEIDEFEKQLERDSWL